MNEAQKSDESRVQCSALLESMADEFQRTARLRRCLWGDGDERAAAWDDAARTIKLKIESVNHAL